MGNKYIDVSQIKQKIIYKNKEDILLTIKKYQKMNYTQSNLKKI